MVRTLIQRTYRFYRKYMALLKMGWAIVIAYRSEAFIWMIGSFFQPLVSLFVWMSIAGDGTVGGYSTADFVLYFVGVLVVGRMTGAWDIWHLDNDIRQGTFSNKLLRPFHPVHWNMADNLASKLFWLLLIVPVWTVLALIFPGLRPPISPLFYLYTFISMMLALLIRFIIGYQIGMLAFWTNRAASIYVVYEGIHLFMSGRIAPLSMFPSWVISLAEWLPFYITVGFPVEMLSGQLTDPVLIGKYFGLQCIWLTVLILLFRLEWKWGIRKYSAVGG
jgi:ABC-2 type transport system permease protein